MQYQQSGLKGYKRRLVTKDDRTCMACLVSDGEIIPIDQVLDDHPRGRCTEVFVIDGAPPIVWNTAQDWFMSQSDETQQAMMGPEKWGLWKDGKFDLQDLRRDNHSSIWGDSPREATIAELLGKDGALPVIVNGGFPSPDGGAMPLDLTSSDIEPSGAIIPAPADSDWRKSSDGTQVQLSEGDIKHGVFDSERVTIRGNGDAILKTNFSDGDGWGKFELKEGFARREVTAFEISKLLGLDIVPETRAFIEDGNYKSLQLWVENTVRAGELQSVKPVLTDVEGPGKMALFDMLVGNFDRHLNNWIVGDDGRLWAIDNGLSLLEISDDAKWFRSRLAGGLERVFPIIEDYRSTNDGKFYLPESFKSTLEEMLGNGNLEQVLGGIRSDRPDIDDKLVGGALDRARVILSTWDQLFSGEPY
jgi:hypothetical protein